MDDIHDFTVEHETYAYYVNCHMKYERCVKLGLLSEVIHSTENKASSDKKRIGTVFPNAEKNMDTLLCQSTWTKSGMYSVPEWLLCQNGSGQLSRAGFT